MKTIKQIFNLRLLAIFCVAAVITSCSDDDDAPPQQNLPEVFTDVTVIFTPVGGGTPVTATANDADGEGPQDLEVQGP
ncbi:MAG: GTP cyclohydrolase, partial [Bacteroidota bacterium]